MPIETAVYGKHGYDTKLIGFHPPTRFDPELIARIEDAHRPARPERITAALARVQIATAGRPLVGVSAAAWLMVVGEELERYPEDVVDEACRRWVRREKWSPSVAELVDECERLMARRRALLRAARKAPVYTEPDNPMRESDEEERPRNSRQVVSAVATQLAVSELSEPQPPRRYDHRAALRRVRESSAGFRLRTDEEMAERYPELFRDDEAAPAVDECEGWGS